MTSKKQKMMFIWQHHTKRWTETPFTWAGKKSPTIISQEQVILHVDMHKYDNAGNVHESSYPPLEAARNWSTRQNDNDTYGYISKLRIIISFAGYCLYVTLYI